MEPMIFEKGDLLYLVTPVAPFDLGDTDFDELAFAADIRQMAPNEHLLWLRGQYVESERENANGHFWTAGDLEIASLTPNLMPITVMHDPRTAVGLIADAKLLTRAASDVPRSRIDTTLAVWKHRFPEVAQEIATNYEQGTLMQSMECRHRWYECRGCGRRYPKLPGGEEAAEWCEHLKAGQISGAAKTIAARRLGQVTFTGTGLIYGTRGAEGAFDQAHLEVFQEEVAEHHERTHIDSRRKPKPRRKNSMEIEDTRYQELLASESKLKELEPRVTTLETEAGKVPDLERKVEETETAKVAAEKERDDLKEKVEQHDEEARASTLAKDRLGKLGKGFTEKLGDFTRGRLEEQAGTLKDEEWDARLKELEETAGVKRDEGGAPSNDGDGGNGDGTFSREETARAAAGGNGNGGTGHEPSASKRRSVVAGLVRSK